jgi:hypothetical protein
MIVSEEGPEVEDEPYVETRTKVCGLWLNENVTRTNLMGYFLLAGLVDFAIGF